MRRNIMISIVIIMISITIVQATKECVVCHMITDLVAPMIERKETKEYIKKEVEKECLELPKKYINYCKFLVERYMDEIINKLAIFTADELCDMFGFCHYPDFKNEENNGDLECLACKFIANFVAKWLEEGKTEDEIIKELEKLCKTFGKLEKQCDKIVETYGKELIKKIVDFGKDKICIILGLCSLNEKKNILILYNMELNSMYSDCKICNSVFPTIRQYIIMGKRDDEIITYMRSYCDAKTDPQEKQDCISFINSGSLNQLIAYIRRGGRSCRPLFGYC